MIFSFQWTIIPLVVSSFLEEWFRIVNNQRKGEKPKGVFSLIPVDTTKKEPVKEKILARIQDLPNWVLFPDFERSEWFNKILDQLWPSIEGFIVTKVRYIEHCGISTPFVTA